MDPSNVIEFLAAVAPRRSPRRDDWDVALSPRDFVWLGPQGLTEAWKLIPGVRTERQVIHGIGIERLAALNALDARRHRIRAGWLWVCGRRRVEGRVEVINAPVASVSIDFLPGAHEGSVAVSRVGPVDIHPGLVDQLDEEERELLEQPYRGRGHAGIVSTAMAVLDRAGFDGIELAPQQDDWSHLPRSQWGQTGGPASLAREIERRFRHSESIYLLLSGMAAYLEPSAVPTTLRAGLERWSPENLQDTALARVYDFGADPTVPPTVEDVQTSLPLNARQRTAVRMARHAPVSVVSGPPGTGKSHVVVAAAVDAIGRGGSVLIATQSDHAAESVCELLDRHPTPPHLRFGRPEHRQEVARQLSSGRHHHAGDAELQLAVEREADARLRYESLRGEIRAALALEHEFGDALRARSSLALAVIRAPGVADEGVDLDSCRRWRQRSAEVDGLLGGVRRSWAQRRLRRIVRARPDTTLDEIGEAIDRMIKDRDVETLIAAGGVDLDPLWAEFAEAEAAWRKTIATLVDTRRRHGGRFAARPGVSALANILRSGLDRRADLLSDIESDDFLDLLPLWVGTLDEIERTLPVVPGLFDLVILDEASQVDQLHAAGALCRGVRAMIVGDPRQLRHVSFQSDAETEEALDLVGVDDSVTRRMLDVRRNSIFDVAAGVAEVTWLDEHFRSVPHLIDFSARHFYDNQLRLMTQHPTVEGRDVIDQRRIEGERVDGVNQAELNAARELIGELAYTEGTGSIGLLSPFRKQADALEDMVLDRFSLNQIRLFGVRTGTAHSFQGSERDTMIISLAIGPDDLGQPLRFLQDPALFNVMVTRARRRIVLLHSFDPDDLPPGLLAEYFRSVDDPPGHIEDPGSARSWTLDMASALSGADARVITDYPVAGWTIDIALGAGDDAVGVECRVHPNGPDAHIERHLTLRRAGWSLTDAFESRWLGRPREAAATIAARWQLGRPAGDTPG